MVKLRHKKLEWALKQKKKGAKNKYLAKLLNIKVRRFQQLCAQYRQTGEVPKLNKMRRPKTELTSEQTNLILQAQKKSKLKGAVSLRLYIQKYYKLLLPKNKIHELLLKNKISKEDYEKKKQRKYCRYERKHSFSLCHLDWHESKVNGKQVCVVIDDASRMIISGGEFNNATSKNSIFLVQESISIAFKNYSSVIHAINTDQGPQFYSTKYDKLGNKGINEFEVFLRENKIKHILSRRNHPQTNGKNERWFRTYEENRNEFDTFEEFINWYNNKIHLGLSRTQGITPYEALISKLRPDSLIGLLFRGK